MRKLNDDDIVDLICCAVIIVAFILWVVAIAVMLMTLYEWLCGIL